MVFVVSRNSAIIFQSPRSPRSEGNMGSSAVSLTHHRPLDFALYSTKAFQKTYWYDAGRKAKKHRWNIGVWGPWTSKTWRRHIWIILNTQTLLEIPEHQSEPREIFLPVSKLMVSMTSKKDTRQASQWRDSLYYLGVLFCSIQGSLS